MKVYIIDDDPMMVDLLTDIMEDEGYDVSSHHAAAYSLSEIRSQKPDCVLVDLQMSEMNGLELCLEIRKIPRLSKTKIIFVSSHSDDSWKQRAREAGSDGYITKPIDAGILIETINNVMAGNP